jgi:hypothetical protein
MDAQRFRVLSARHRALVAVAVLLDGREAANYLESDGVNGTAFKKAAIHLADQAPELRMPYVGSMLREALAELRSGRDTSDS